MRVLTNHISFLLLLFVVIFASCNTNKLTTTEEKDYIYDVKIKELNPNFLVYHSSDTLSFLYFKIHTKELLYTRENSNKPFKTKLKIHYEVFESERGKVLIDSSSKLLIDYKTSKEDKIIIGKIPINIKQGTNSVMKIVVQDLNKLNRVEEIVRINKTDVKSSQYFLIKKDEIICFDSYFNTNVQLELESEKNKNSTMEIKVFYRKNSPARPPFSRQNVYDFPDTANEIRPVSFVNGVANMRLDSLASYYFKSKNSNKNSFVLEKFDLNFDKIQNFEGMINPMKYICSTKEYEALKSSKNKQKDVEQFWIKFTGNKAKAKLLISEYYRRVEGANKFFTSYKEGWKTDRGMISIVFGMPNSIQKTRFSETWVYGNAHNVMLSLTFNFEKENKDISNNDFQLRRYRAFRNQWYRACESWRSGKAYNYN